MSYHVAHSPALHDQPSRAAPLPRHLVTVLHLLEAPRVIDTAALRQEGVATAVVGEQDRMIIHTFHARHFRDRGHQLPDVEEETGHIQDHLLERHRGEEEVHQHHEVLRGEDEEARATVLTAAIVGVVVEPEPGPGVGEVTVGEDERPEVRTAPAIVLRSDAKAITCEVGGEPSDAVQRLVANDLGAGPWEYLSMGWADKNEL